jgi:phosphotriesterase-related protein
MHEHTVFGFAGAELDYRLDRPSRTTQLETVAGHLRAAAATGVSTIVDAACPDLGRDVEFDIALARASGVNIILATGLYSLLPLPHYANPWRPATAEDLAENFIREIEAGIGDSGVRAGVIKVATPKSEFTEYAMTAFRAAAQAHAKTGAPIITHTEAGTLGLEQVNVLSAEGADLSRIVIGHNDTADLAYLTAIADRGAVVGFDRFGYEESLPERLRLAALLAMLKMGYAERVILSQDCNIGRILPKNYAAPARAIPPTYARVTEVVIPALKAAGITERTIQTILVDNPRRILSGASECIDGSNGGDVR